ncbi:MAG: thermonuclease family protein [Candidatus Nanopelagicales bacterium]
MSKARPSILVGAFVALSCAACSPSTPAASADPRPAPTADVVKVVDGDTIDVRDDQRGRLRIRVLGIDTPETVDPNRTVGCWGPEASAFARDALAGQRVALVGDPTQDSHDKYGRTLAYIVKADGWDYSIEAARAGAARSVVFGRNPVERQGAIAAAEQEAREGHVGMWGPPCWGNTQSTPR